MTIAAVAIEVVRLYASAEKNEMIRKAWMQAAMTMRLICGDPCLLSAPHSFGRRPASDMHEVVSAESSVNESHAPPMDRMMASAMNVPPQPGAIRSNR